MDIEEDIKELKELNNLLKFFKTHGWIPNLSRNTNINETIKAIEHILAEREEDKKKINKLEYRIEELKKYNKTISDRVVEYKKNCIPKQKVKEKIEENNKLIEKCKDELEHYGEIYLYEHDNKILKELLEDK